MNHNNYLVNQVRAHVTNGVPPGAFHPDVLTALLDATTEFPLAPDEFVDVGRLPPAVVDLATLFAHLRSIKQKLAAKSSEVKTVDWEVAKSGELRLYKLYICALHALHSFLGTAYDATLTPNDFALAAIAFAQTNPPADLAEKGTKLWQKTFDGTSSRCLAVMKSLLYFCSQTAANIAPVAGAVAPVQGNPPPTVPAPGVPSVASGTGSPSSKKAATVTGASTSGKAASAPQPSASSSTPSTSLKSPPQSATVTKSGDPNDPSL